MYVCMYTRLFISKKLIIVKYRLIDLPTCSFLGHTRISDTFDVNINDS